MDFGLGFLTWIFDLDFGLDLGLTIFIIYDIFVVVIESSTYQRDIFDFLSTTD